jgi:hypothetical protein
MLQARPNLADEALFRVLVAIGTLIYKDPAIRAAACATLPSVLGSICEIPRADKVQQALSEVQACMQATQ